MNLLSLHLVNIRSYREERIDFRNGITLFEGDIGSGKSSILNAVEFALFGLGDQNGSHLLRVGENEGSVELAIQVNGKEYVFGRGLTRKRSNVSQDQCYIVEDGVQTSHNATSMKRRALQILGFKEPPSPRSQSVIYRYAVFTPQEQMREVIRQKPESRKETLRKALGIEEYSIAASNATTILSTLRSEAKALEKSLGDAELTQSRIDDEEKNIEEKNSEISKSQEALEKIGVEKLRIQGELEEKKKTEAERNTLSQNLKLLEQEKKRIEDDIAVNSRALAENKLKLTSATQKQTRLKELYPLFNEYKQIRSELPKLQKKYETDRSLKQQIEIITTRINAKRGEFEDQLQEAADKIVDLDKKIGSLEDKLAKLPQLSNEISSLDGEVADIDSIRDDYEHNRKDHSITQQEIDQLEIQKGEKQAEWETISSLGVGATCPRCQQTLNEKHYKLLESKIEKEIGKIDEKIAGRKTKQIEIEEKTNSDKAKLADLEKKVRRLNKLRVEEATLGKDRETRDRYLTDEAEALDRKSEHEAMLENDSFADDQKQEIATINSQRTELKPYVQRYDELRNRSTQFEDMHVEDEYNESKAIVDRLPELTATQTTLESNKVSKKATLEERTGDLSKVTAGLKKFEGLDEELSSLQEKDKALIRDEATEAARIKAQKADVEAAGQRITRLEEDLTRYKKDLLEAEGLQIVETWIREILIPSLQMIEKNILLSLNQEFNKMFKRWFSELIESEELQGLIDEDFTPVVEQSGYGLDVESLSGGEKTSVALSYRLALNTIVKQATNTMKSNMLILDEPTDGFSKEQLFKMRDILNELDCSQVILVSHEKELETVADYIYRVRKDGNVSTVVPPI